MQFKCPKCSGIVSIDAVNLGKTVSCGHCNEVVTAPAGAFDSGMIINDFIIQKELGFGGMGIVYLAQQMTLDRPVALKILKDKYAEDNEFVVQFVREARAAAKLNHPNIVQAYAVGEENGVYFFAMEYVDGKTMKEELAEQKKIKPDIAAKIIIDIAGALDYAWTENKIVHHDIKPDNIMLNKNGRAKLADLGLAGIFGDSAVDEDEDEVLGTPQYISPEQLLGEPTDVRSDIYSLGATFYHFLTGEFPYTGNSATEIAHQHVNGTFIPPAQKDKSVPAALNDIITKMMAKDVANRYQSAADVVADLKKYFDKPQANTASTDSAAPGKSAAASGPGAGNRLKLSIGGMPKAPAAPASAPKASSAPQVQLSKPNTASVATPKIQLSASQNAAAPKIQLSTPAAAPPKVQLSAAAPAASAPAAPKIGLKKAESAAPENEPAPEKAAPAAVLEKSAEKAKATSGKKKKTEKVEKEKNKGLQKTLITVLFLLLACGGGITWYLYKNNWKAPIIDQVKAWNKEREEVAKTIVHRVPVKPKKELTIQELRKDYVPEIEKIVKFLKDNPTKGKEFLQKVETFIHDNGTPELENEKVPFAGMQALVHREDEKVWMAAARAKAASAHSAEINRRVQQEKNRIAEEARIQAEKKAENARRAALQKAEAEQRRKEAEEKRKLEERMQIYRQKIAKVYPEFAKLFAAAFADEKKVDELKRKVDNLFTDYNPDGVQMQIHRQVDEYGRRLLAELPRIRKMYQFMTEQRNLYKGHFIVLPRYRQVEILDVDFEKHQFTGRSVTSDRVYKISLDDAQMRKRLFDMYAKKMPKNNEMKYLPFYYEVFFGKLENAAKMTPPSPVWKEVFRYIR